MKEQRDEGLVKLQNWDLMTKKRKSHKMYVICNYQMLICVYKHNLLHNIVLDLQYVFMDLQT